MKRDELLKGRVSWFQRGFKGGAHYQKHCICVHLIQVNFLHFPASYFEDVEYACPGFMRTKFSVPSSFFTCLNTSQDMQETDFWAKSPCTFPPQKVPATAQQIRPAFLPLFAPSEDVSSAAGHIPISSVLDPPRSLPHFFTSQQFFFDIVPSLYSILFPVPGSDCSATKIPPP